MATPDDALLRGVAGVLAGNPGASMTEIAAAAGTSRATLHRRFPTREDLTVAVAHHALDECDRIFDAAGMDDDRPAAEVLEALSREALALAVAYELLWVVPPITDHTDMEAEAALRDDRFERFAARAQAAGQLRADVPARWVVYSVGSQAVALRYAVIAGFVGAREAERLFRTTILDGLGAPTSGSGSGTGQRPGTDGGSR
jgi:AcrR family transcriptional regulator